MWLGPFCGHHLSWQLFAPDLILVVELRVTLKSGRKILIYWWTHMWRISRRRSNVVPLWLVILCPWLLGSGSWPVCFRLSFGLLPVPYWRGIGLILIPLVIGFPLGLAPVLIPGIIVPTHGFKTTFTELEFLGFETEKTENGSEVEGERERRRFIRGVWKCVRVRQYPYKY